MVDNRNLSTIQNRLAELAKLPKMKENSSIMEVLSEHGFTRRDFMKWAGAMTALMALPASFAPMVAQAAELSDRLPVIWLHM